MPDEPVTLTQNEVDVLKSLARTMGEPIPTVELAEQESFEDVARRVTREEIASLAGKALRRTQDETLTRNPIHNEAEAAANRVMGHFWGEVLAEYGGEPEVPDYIARAIEAQGKTTVDDVLAVLRETRGIEPAEPVQEPLVLEIGPTTVIEGEQDPRAFTDDHCAAIDAERRRRAIANGSKAHKGAGDTLYAGAAKAEREFAKYVNGWWVSPLTLRAGGKVDVRDRHGREYDVKDQKETTLSMEDDDSIFTYFARHLLIVRPGWKQHRDLVTKYPSARANLIIWAMSLPAGWAVDVEDFLRETP